MSIDPKTTALVMIEYQNDFTTEGGAMHGAVSAVMEKTGMLERTRDVVAAARRVGATVMHAPTAFAEGYGEISSDPYGILKGDEAVDEMQRRLASGRWLFNKVDR